MCGLVDHADASVGSLSIEHRKCTTLGVELAAKVHFQAALHSSYSTGSCSLNFCCFWTNLRQVSIRRVPGLSCRS
jgi:hypothetical protein